ncbi:MAG: ATP-binding protein, partial [Alphaproteobacteria bacterium]
MSTLVKTAQRFEVQIAWAISDASRGHIDENIQKQLTQSFSELASLFVAICLVEDQGEQHKFHGHNDIGLPWHILVHNLGGELNATKIAAHMSPHPMPALLTKLWHSPQPPNKRNLEVLIGDLLHKSHAIVKAKGVYTDEHYAKAEAIEALGSTELTAAFNGMMRAMDKATARQNTRAFLILLGCCVVGICIALLNALLVFSPMEQTILNGQKELVEERDRARASERAKRDFLAVMSHELRTPMNGILGFTNLLKNTDLSEKQQDYAETIHDSGEILLTILNDILDVSRIEAGAFELETEDFNISDIVSNVVTLLGPRAFAKRLELSAYIDPSLPEMLNGDSGRLRQILLNLVGNAIKFTMSGGIAIEVRYLGRKPENQHDIILSVTDTGIGIPKDKQAEIFGYFTQVDISASRKFEGTGLGLAICKKIAELMNGQIGVESVPDRGSTFFVQLELEGVTPPAAQISTSLNVNIEGARILIVDDNALNRRIFRLQLEAFG